MVGTLNVYMYYNKIATKSKSFIFKFQFLEAAKKKKKSFDEGTQIL